MEIAHPLNVQYLKRIELSLLPFFGECSEHGREGGLQKIYIFIHT